MPINKNRDLYSFTVDIPKQTTKEVEVEKEFEIEKEVEKKKRRKNKETGKMEYYTEKVMQPTTEKRVVTEERTVTEDVPVKIIFRRPTRTQLEDGDMFYSIWLNKFIKMGLLTRAMLAKQHIDVGGTMDEEEKQYYSQLYVKLFEKQMALQRFAVIGSSEMTSDQSEKRERLIAEIGLIRKELTDFETVQANMFEHTADIKARNKTITWYLLNLAHFQDLEDEGSSPEPMFSGENYDEKYEVYKSKEDEDDEIFWGSIDKLSSIATIWYMSGVQEQEDFDTLLEEISDDVNLDDTNTGTTAPREEAESAE
jgi:hypothetical protein